MGGFMGKYENYVSFNKPCWSFLTWDMSCFTFSLCEFLVKIIFESPFKCGCVLKGADTFAKEATPLKVVYKQMMSPLLILAETLV